MQAQAVYQPQSDITGPAFSAWFKMLATLFSLALIGYILSFILRYPGLPDGAQLFLLAAIAVVLLYWRDFLRATLTINAFGIRQTGWLVQQVSWDDVRGAKLIGLSRLGWLMPPRLAVRTGTGFHTFNCGSPELFSELQRISLAYQLKT
jgi:hypothetical protein